MRRVFDLVCLLSLVAGLVFVQQWWVPLVPTYHIITFQPSGDAIRLPRDGYILGSNSPPRSTRGGPRRLTVAPSGFRAFAGFATGTGTATYEWDNVSSQNYRVVLVPHWFPVLLSAVIPVWWAVSRAVSNSKAHRRGFGPVFPGGGA